MAGPWVCGGRLRGGDAEVDGGPMVATPVELGELVFVAGEADSQPFDLAEPALALGFRDAGVKVVSDLHQAAALGGVGPEHRAADAGFSEPTSVLFFVAQFASLMTVRAALVVTMSELPHGDGTRGAAGARLVRAAPTRAAGALGSEPEGVSGPERGRPPVGCGPWAG